MRVLVTDGDSRAALAVVRSLGARGETVYVASEKTPSMAGASRMAAGEYPVPEPMRSPRAWVEALDRLVDALAIDLLIPMTEVALGNLYACEREHRWPVVCPSRESYEIAVDKHALIERARAHGLSCPRGIAIEVSKGLDALPEGFSYPVIVKARRSRAWVSERWVEGAVLIARDDRELGEASRRTSAAGGALLQEYLPGRGEGIFLLAREGEPLACFAHRRLREKPPTGGTSVLRESIAPDPALRQGCERLLASLCWNGAAMLEFRRTPGGEAALLELNPRFWGSLQLAIDAGIDFPSLLADLHSGRSVVPAEARLGVRSRWLLGDFDHLLLCARSPALRDRAGLTLLRVVMDFLESFVDGSRSEVWRIRDPKPFWRELVGWVRDLGSA